MATRGAAETSGGAKRRYYDVLEVAADATTADIRRAFRRLARRHHPDRNPGDPRAEERFKEILRAHDVLVDARLRALYDEFGDDGLRRGFDASRARRRAAGPIGRNGDRGDGSPEPTSAPPRRRRGAIEEFFGGLFARSRPPERGSDVEVTVAVDFLEALGGTERTLSLRRPERCRACDVGNPRDDGRVCEVCEGSGVAEASVRIKARIPAGVLGGSRIRLAGQGGAGKHGGPSGDLWLAVQVAEHPRFGRDGADVTIDVPVTVAEAVRGARLTIPTPEGQVQVRIPAGTQSGRRLRLRGKGAPRLDEGPRGDLIARVLICVPESGESLEEIADSLEPLYSDSFRRRFE